LKRESFMVEAPGRVCLFGEHSDYLGLGVIAAAINLSIRIIAKPITEKEIRILYRDTDQVDTLGLHESAEYRNSRDYVRSAFNLVRTRGITPSTGWQLEVSGSIPIAAGLSSSSALTVAAVRTFSKIMEADMEPGELAHMAFRAEVTEFNESGGMMDHFASAFGNVIHLDPAGLTLLPARLTGLIIGDSLEPKSDTVGDLARIRSLAEEGYQRLSKIIPGFDHLKTPMEQIRNHIKALPERCRKTTLTTLQNRDLTNEAYRVLFHSTPDVHVLGSLITRHHTLLRDGLHRSTKKIEAMIEAANAAGALGCKINGSGGGGTMLALAPGSEDKVVGALQDAEAEAYRIEVGKGCSLTLSDD
jgi:galactokinase